MTPRGIISLNTTEIHLFITSKQQHEQYAENIIAGIKMECMTKPKHGPIQIQALALGLNDILL